MPGCEAVFNKYVDQLKDRYQGERKELIDVVVKDSEIFEKFNRKDRGWFYAIFGKNFSEMMGEPDQRQLRNE